MGDNRVAGPTDDVKDAANDAVGWAVSDPKLQSDGEPQKALGRIQNYGSGLNDAVRDAEAMRSAGLLVVTLERDAGE